MKNWIDYSFVVRSTHRKRVFEALNNPKTPTQLAKDLDINIGYISNILISLLDRKLIKCLNPYEKRHRLYEWSKKGRSLFENMLISPDKEDE